MIPALKEIIDLDYLLGLDEQADSMADREALNARDRDIFTQLNIDRPGGSAPGETDKVGLIFSWLEYRKLLFFHEADKGGEALLPGRVFASLYRWMVLMMLGLGLAAGASMAYSFLAYHGRQPVNVTAFTAVFILVPLLLSLLTLAGLVFRYASEKAGSKAPSQTLVHSLMVSLFFKKLPGLLDRAGIIMGNRHPDTMAYTSALIRMKNREYKGIFFWPFFLFPSFFAMAFSGGALIATMFRVLVTDLAFGWQSTLVRSSDRVLEIVSALALPWSWFMESSHPDLVQIEGSRILLKEGIMGLASGDLVSWWPFLCMGMLVYGVLPRVFFIAAGFLAQKNALAGIDLDRPRFRRLLVRMQTPVMDINFDESPVSRAAGRSPLPVPDLFDSTTPGPGNAGKVVNASPLPAGREGGGPGGEAFASQGPACQDSAQDLHALVLASDMVYGSCHRERIARLIQAQFSVKVDAQGSICFDYEADLSVLGDFAGISTRSPVIILHEVWQPPIRGLLFYLAQLKTQVFPDRPLWILLTQTPEEENLGVDKSDINFRVWQKAVSKLGDKNIFLERLYR